MTSDQSTSDTEPPDARNNKIDFDLPKILADLQSAVWKKRPILHEILIKNGKKTLNRYVRDFLDVNKSPLLDARKNELIRVAERLIAERLGAKIASEVAAQLKAKPLVSMIDHHGIIDNPFFVNSNISSAIPYPNTIGEELKYLIVFSFASVSLNNASAYPRGLEFHGDGLEQALIRLPILPDKLKMGVVYAMRSFNNEDLDKANKMLLGFERDGKISHDLSQKVKTLMDDLCREEDVLSAPNFSAQITKINYKFWPRMFHPSRASARSRKGVMPSPCGSGLLIDAPCEASAESEERAHNILGKLTVPNLIYLEIESLVREVLFEYHLGRPSSLIYRLLFDEKYRMLALKFFNCVEGGFSLEDMWGTYLFWAVDKKLHRVRLQLKDGKLGSEDGEYIFDFTPEAILLALKEKKIFPSMLLSHIVVSLYYGMKCLGGFCQVHNLTVMKDAWQKLLAEVGEHEEAVALDPVQTKEFGGDMMILAYLENYDGELYPATGIDLAFAGVDTNFEVFIELSKKVTLEEMINPMFVEMYKILYPSFERDNSLLMMEPSRIIRANGLQDRLKVFGEAPKKVKSLKCHSCAVPSEARSA